MGKNTVCATLYSDFCMSLSIFQINDKNDLWLFCSLTKSDSVDFISTDTEQGLSYYLRHVVLSILLLHVVDLTYSFYALGGPGSSVSISNFHPVCTTARKAYSTKYLEWKTMRLKVKIDNICSQNLLWFLHFR